MVLLTAAGIMLVAADVPAVDAGDQPRQCQSAACGPPNRVAQAENHPPEVRHGEASTTKNVSISGSLEELASDQDGDELTYFSRAPAGHGSVTISPAGEYTYVPNCNYVGPDRFSFIVSDGHGARSQEAQVDVSVVETALRFSGCVISSGKVDQPVSRATVHLVPAIRVVMTKLTSEVLRGDSAADEPLEDTIENFPDEVVSATTNSKGGFDFSSVAEGRYFIHVTPSPGDRLHLPGGDASRVSRSADELRGGDGFQDRSVLRSVSGRSRVQGQSFLH